MAAEFEKGAKIERMERNLDNPERALKQIGVMMVSESQTAFREQRLGDVAWQPRGKVNVMGIIADFAAGKKAPPARRFQTRPALQDTGRLAGSIAHRLVSSHVVEVGTNLPYAGVLHHGGEVESLPINQQVRDGLSRWLKGRGKEYREQLGWLLNEKFADQTIKMTVPKRPIVGITKQTIEDIRTTIGVKIMEAD